MVNTYILTVKQGRVNNIVVMYLMLLFFYLCISKSMLYQNTNYNIYSESNTFKNIYICCIQIKNNNIIYILFIRYMVYHIIYYIFFDQFIRLILKMTTLLN